MAVVYQLISLPLYVKGSDLKLVVPWYSVERRNLEQSFLASWIQKGGDGDIHHAAADTYHPLLHASRPSSLPQPIAVAFEADR